MTMYVVCSQKKLKKEDQLTLDLNSADINQLTHDSGTLFSAPLIKSPDRPVEPLVAVVGP